MVRCKFTVDSVQPQEAAEGAPEEVTVKLSAVADGSPENKAFFAATPWGVMEFTALKSAVGHMEVGDEFYLDIWSSSKG